MYIVTYRGVYSQVVDGIGLGATTRSLPDFMAAMHLRFAARLTAWTKAGCRNASKLWWSVMWCRELIVERMRSILRNIFRKWSNPFIPYRRYPSSWGQSEIERKAEHDDRARRGITAMCLSERSTWIINRLTSRSVKFSVSPLPSRSVPRCAGVGALEEAQNLKIAWQKSRDGFDCSRTGKSGATKPSASCSQ